MGQSWALVSYARRCEPHVKVRFETIENWVQRCGGSTTPTIEAARSAVDAACAAFDMDVAR